jgi:UDP-3-O-[3-hydroxymyristoyl] glucosamine N-acyltransferase
MTAAPARNVSVRPRAGTFLRRTITAQDVLALVCVDADCDLIGIASAPVEGIASLASGFPHGVAYAAGNISVPSTAVSSSVVLCEPSNADALAAASKIVVPDSRAAFIRLVIALQDEIGLDYRRTIAQAGTEVRTGDYEVHHTSIIEDDVIIGAGAKIGPYAVILRGAIIGEGTIVRSGTVIGEAGAAVHTAADGTMLAQPHVGIVWIGANCEIGANCAVIRAMLGQTVIAACGRVGNFANIGHGAIIGERVWLGAGTIIGGHATIGRQATLGMGVLVRDNVAIGEQASIAMGAVVTKPVPDGASAFGNPAKIVARRLLAGPVR